MYVMLLFIVLFSSANKPVEKQNPANPKNKGSQTQIAVPVTSATPGPSIEKPNSETREDNNSNPPSNGIYKVEVEQTPPDYWMRAYVIINLLVAAAAVTSLFLIRHQRDVMKAQLQAMRDQLTEMRRSREQTAKDLSEANKINREALQAVQRAYIAFLLDIENAKGVDDKTGERKDWWFWVPVQNTGVTPAIDLTIHANWVCQPNPLEENFTFPDYADKHIPFVVPGKARITSPALKIGEEWIKRVYERSHYLYFYGWAEYGDVFEGTLRHVTTFCFEITIHQIIGNDLRCSASFHHRHNTQT